MGDLLPDGKIRSVETLNEFASPSAWAYNCKSVINKIKKAGCGWSSVSTIHVNTLRKKIVFLVFT